MKEKVLYEQSVKKKQEEEKLSLIKRQQVEWAKLNQERKVKNFTYNYDGTMLMIFDNYKERLPPSQIVVPYEVRQIEKGKKSRANRMKFTTKVSKGNNLNTKTNEGEMINEDFQEMEPSAGVTIKAPGMLKTGKKIHEKVSEIDLTSKTLKLTKSEYNKLVKGGNLSRERGANGKGELDKGNSGIGISDKRDYQPISEFGNQEYYSKSKRGNFKMGKINIDSVDSLKRDILAERFSKLNFPHATTEAKKGINLDTNKYLDEVDKFNMTLLDNKTWGNAKGISNFPNINSKNQRPFTRSVIRSRNSRTREKVKSSNSLHKYLSQEHLRESTAKDNTERFPFFP